MRKNFDGKVLGGPRFYGDIYGKKNRLPSWPRARTPYQKKDAVNQSWE